MWFFGADWHLGHSNIIKYCKRPFMSREEEGLLAMADRGVIPASEVKISRETTELMTDTIIDSVNAVVDANDTIVHVGDFCWTPRERRYETAKRFRDRIKCKNMFIIWGNHDDPKVLAPLFTAAYSQYNFNIDGQHVFASHYPARSWDMAHHGAWMVYGHVHNLYWPEDNGKLMPYQEQVYRTGFHEVLKKYGVNMDNSQHLGTQDEFVQDLLDVVASTNGVDLTIDVGVDNVREGVPFGTPWSMKDLADHMDKRMSRWQARSKALKNLRPPSTLKLGNPNANPYS